MKKLFIAAVLGLDAMYRFWEKIKDVRESFVENNKKENYADGYEKTLKAEKLCKISSVFLGNKDDFCNDENPIEKYGRVLIFPGTAERIWQGTAIDHTKDDFGYFMAIKANDLDNSVKILIAKVWKDTGLNHQKYFDVLSINYYKDFQHALSEIQYTITCYSNITLLLMPNGIGMGFAQLLKNNGIGFNEIHWGGQCFTEHGTKNYVNKRSQAFVDLSRAVHKDRIKIKTQHFMDEIKEQLVSLHYDFDEHARFKVLNPKEMMKAPNSLEMAELLAYMFLDGVDYKVASDEQAVREKT